MELQVIDRIKFILTDLTGLEFDAIADDAPLRPGKPGSLELDSIDRMEFAMELEDEFQIEIPDDDCDQIDASVTGVVAYINRRLGCVVPSVVQAARMQ